MRSNAVVTEFVKSLDILIIKTDHSNFNHQRKAFLLKVYYEAELMSTLVLNVRFLDGVCADMLYYVIYRSTLKNKEAHFVLAYGMSYNIITHSFVREVASIVKSIPTKFVGVPENKCYIAGRRFYYKVKY